MNLKNRLLHLAQASGMARQFGKTTAICKAAKEIDAIVLTATHLEAKHLERKFDVKAKSVELNLYGFSGPFLFDNHAIEKLFVSASNKIQTLEDEIEKLKKENEQLTIDLVVATIKE